MAILINGMEIPEHCMDCPFMVSRDNDDCILQSDAANESFETWEQMKAGCPLIEVPEPHGRLIDADALRDNNSSVIEINSPDGTILAIDVAIIDDAPTVIPASEDEIDEAQRDYQAAADYQQYCETYEQTYDPDTGAM